MNAEPHGPLSVLWRSAQGDAAWLSVQASRDLAADAACGSRREFHDEIQLVIFICSIY
jgi:hypothetical protein